MQLVTEIDLENQKVLIVDKTSSVLLKELKKELLKYGTDVFVSPQILPNTSQFKVIYFINQTFLEIKDILKHPIKTRLLFISLNQSKVSSLVEQYIRQFYPHKVTQLKVIDIQTTSTLTKEDMEKILWLSFSSSSEVLLPIHSQKKEDDAVTLPQAPKVSMAVKLAKKTASPKRILKYIAFFFLLLHLAFVPPLILTNYLFYQTERAARKDISSAVKKYKDAHRMLNVTKALYNAVRPTYQLLSLSYYTDGIIQFDESISLTFEKSFSLFYSANTFTKLLLKKNKTSGDVQVLQSTVKKMAEDLDAFNQYVTILQQKLPEWQQLDSTRLQLKEVAANARTAQEIVPQFDSLFAKDTEKQYLILFANNMELRPGGGFIGSFGVLKVHNYTVDPIKVYDVYDADGQLQIHIDPPDPIRLYLQQPHWFLRDSAFSPDFPTNYNQAKVFLKEELGMTRFDGGVLLTTTTIQNILEGMGDLYIPDFKETVNKKNFYIKAQLYSEKNFFPGSTQKKRFLTAVADQLLLNLETTSQINLLQMVKKSLEEKQMVLYFEDPALQEKINSLYWSGKTLVPQCPTGFSNCINNYIFPYEANLGVNKANFFVKKLISVRSVIDKEGVVSNKLQITLKNESLSDIFPGGIYKNYFQLLLPATSVVNRITKNDTLVEQFDSFEGTSKTVGFYVETPPQSTTKLEIDYNIETGLDNGKGAFQLVVQKQIGSPNSEFQFELSYPDNIHPVSQNFSPLVKPNKILYNTTLTADKIFFIELFKE